MARPTDYKGEYSDQAYKLTLLGATDKKLADFFNTSEQTINAWKKRHPKFLESITRGKQLADAEIAEALFHRARGYSHVAVKMFQAGGSVMQEEYLEQYPPDTAAASLWLRNRQPALWRDKQDVEHTGEVAHNIKVSFE